MEAENWYLKNKSKIMREVRFALRSYRTEFEKAYGKKELEAITKEALRRFEVLLPDLRYIGGNENRLSKALYITAAMLAMYEMPGRMPGFLKDLMNRVMIERQHPKILAGFKALAEANVPAHAQSGPAAVPGG